MKIIVLSIFILNLNVILFRQNYADASQHQGVQAIQLGEGIKYPSHPLSETETRAKVGHFGDNCIIIILFSQNHADAYQHQRMQAMKLEEGIQFPSHPLSETETRARLGNCHNKQAHKRLVLIACAQKPY